MQWITDTRRVALLAIALLCVAAPVWGTNGMYLAGYGSEAAGRGGANLGVADHALGLQANPAGITHIRGHELNVDAQVLAPQLKYSGDPLGNAMDGASKVFIMPSLSYAQGTESSPISWGVAFLSQGDIGATFENYLTPYGTRDKTSSEVRFATLSPTIAYEMTDEFSIGVSGHAGYSDLKLAFWPNTSQYESGSTPNTQAGVFFGSELTTRPKAFLMSARGGALWHAHPKITFGAIYQTETTGDYTNGTLTSNQTSANLGKVQYDAKVTGFTWPAQIGGGVEVRPLSRVMLAGDVRRYLWNHAMKQITVTGTNPSSSQAQSTITMPFLFNWKDQWVVNAGAEFAATPEFTVRGGYNYGKSPVPDETLTPLFPATTLHHATGGFTWTRFGNSVTLAVERAFNAEQINRNTNPLVNPFGAGMCVDHAQWTFSAGFGRSF